MRISHRVRLVAGVCVALAVVITPALLFAHAKLVRSVPAVDGHLDASPTGLSLWFSERPELRFTTLQLLDSADVAVPLGAIVRTPDDPMGVTAPIASALVSGRYTVAWRTAAADGHATSGRFSFVVSAIAPADPPPSDTVARTPRRMPNTIIEPAQSTVFTTGARWAELMAVVTLVGAMIFRLFILREARLLPDLTTEAVDRVRRLAHAVLALFVVTTVWRLSAQADLIPTAATARVAAMLTVVGDTAWGRGWLVGAAGAVVVALGLRAAKGSSRGWLVATLGVVAICFSESLTGHAGALRHRAALAMAIDLAHLLGAGGWIGGLAVLLVCGFPATAKLNPVERTRAGQILLRAYHRAAIECVALVLITAVLAVWIRFSALSDFWTSQYGRILLLKLSLAIGALAFGFYHWRTAVIPTWAEDTGFRFNRSAMMELVIGAAVIGATAVLVSTALPLS